MVKGLSHITFIVSDLDRMEMLLTTVLDARKVYDSGDHTFSLLQQMPGQFPYCLRSARRWLWPA